MTELVAFLEGGGEGRTSRLFSATWQYDLWLILLRIAAIKVQSESEQLIRRKLLLRARRQHDDEKEQEKEELQLWGLHWGAQPGAHPDGLRELHVFQLCPDDDGWWHGQRAYQVAATANDDVDGLEPPFLVLAQLIQQYQKRKQHPQTVQPDVSPAANDARDVRTAHDGGCSSLI